MGAQAAAVRASHTVLGTALTASLLTNVSASRLHMVRRKISQAQVQPELERPV